MEQKPVSLRCVLSASEGVELNKLVEITERIFGHSRQSQVLATNDPRSETPASSQTTTFDFTEGSLANVEKQIREFSTTVKYIQNSLKTAANTYERRTNSRTRSATPPGEKI
jgi:hypothetical protein